ncbi:large ribosomal subunit protein eL20z-like isoform X1 [Typha latifolia]|uniref:large ribosomal subunit protein eL20z-like isoform X1 n=1 Tax=Typha latifolia TaxID=4733 RepID=UPI003C2F33F9
MSEEEGKSRGVMGEHQQQQQYGTFQGGIPSYSTPAMGFPQPAPPPGASGAGPTSYPPPYPAATPYYSHGYQAVPGYAAVAEGRPLRVVRLPRLPCCGIGLGWFLFIIGFFLAAIPWYIGAFILLCARIDYREKPGYTACTIAAILAAIAVVLGLTKGSDVW